MIGKFRAQARSTDIELVGEKQSPKIMIQFEITEEGPEHGKSVYCDRFLTEAALPYTYEDLKACGFTGGPGDIVDLEGLKDASMALRNPVILICDEENYVGKRGPFVKTVVKFINRIGGGPVVAKDRMSDRERAVLKAKLKASSVAVPERAQQVKPPVKPPAPKQDYRDEFADDGDKIPF